jgi:hypothetical protein
VEGIVLTAVIAAGLEFLVVFLAAYNHRRVRWITRTPTSAVCELTDGVREIHGTVTALAQTRPSPLSRVPCVYFDFTVEQLRRSGRSSHWHQLVRDRQGDVAGVDDGTGVAEVDLADAELHLETDAHGRSSGFLNGCPPELEAVLPRYGVSPSSFLGFSKSLRYREIFVEPGDRLYVLGEVYLREDNPPRFIPGKKIPLLVSDRGETGLVKSFRMKFLLFAVLSVLIPAGVAGLYFLVFRGS